MGKMKKKFRKKFNPEKSDKLIIAVTVGVVLVLGAVLVIMILSSGGGKAPVNKGELMENTLKYLKKTEGIAQIKFYPEKNTVVIIYEGYKEDMQNFPTIARFAGLKLSYQMGDEELTMILAKDKEEQVVARFRIKNGRVL